jgi:5-methylcytosine-specific restriction endonuclease McrA
MDSERGGLTMAMADSTGHECPTCGRDNFASENGMKTHHKLVHGESIAGVKVKCDNCGSPIFQRAERADQSHHFCDADCYGEWCQTPNDEDYPEYPDGVDCPSCDRSFETENGMKVHHEKVHGESIAGVEVECTNCSESFRESAARAEKQNHHFCDMECFSEFQRIDLPRETVTELYKQKGLSIGDIADHLELSETLIYNRVAEWGLESSAHTEPYHSEEWLRCEYLGKEKTTIEIADECDVTPRTIGDHLQQIGINAQEVGMKRTRSRITVECAFCSEELERYPAHTGDTNRFFCEKNCEGQWLAENRSGEDHPDYNRIEVECALCSTEFTVQPHRTETTERVFCDLNCRGEWLSKNQVGDAHPNWQGGAFPYGKGWTEEKREVIRERDDRECQICGMTEPAHQAEFDRHLDVHHIKPAREFDDPVPRNAVENLITLCIHCHKKAEKTAPLLPASNVR